MWTCETLIFLNISSTNTAHQVSKNVILTAVTVCIIDNVAYLVLTVNLPLTDFASNSLERRPSL